MSPSSNQSGRQSSRPSGGGGDEAARRARFDADILAADLTVSDDDRERLFAMWTDHLPWRESLRAADVALEQEPSFIEKPAMLGGGASTTGTSGTTSAASPSTGRRGGGA